MDQLDQISRFVSKVKNSNLIFEKRDLSLQVKRLETKLGKRLPRSFRYFISNYSFIPFEFGKIYVFGNHRTHFPKQLDPPVFYDEFNPEKSDLSNAIFQDKFLYGELSKNGFIQFARPSDESFDPVCFDARQKKSNYEYLIVRLDHEEILINRKIKVVESISNSFNKYISDFLNN